VQEEFDGIVFGIELVVDVTYFSVCVVIIVECVSTGILFIAVIHSSKSDSVFCDVDVSELIAKNSFLIKTKI
jgi:hypothetical protein